MRRNLITTGLVLGFVGSTVDSVSAQARLFLIRQGDDPASAVFGANVQIQASPGETIVFEAWGESLPPGANVFGCQIALPCSDAFTLAGTIDHQPPVVANKDNPSWVFFGYMLAFSAVDHGNCPLAGPRVAAAFFSTMNVPLMVGKRYVGEFTYVVSPDAAGTATLTIFNEPASIINNQDGIHIPFTTDGADITILFAKCCQGVTCGDLTEFACNASGGYFDPAETCADSCACSTAGDCAADDENACTCNRCTGGACARLTTRYGNVTCDAAHTVDVDDILCAINGFGNPASCRNADIVPGCTGDGIINIDDIVEVVDAFGGANPCGCAP